MKLPKAGYVLAPMLGLLIGLIAYTFIYAKGYSYLSNNPATCANCHVMNAYYDGWVKGSHRSAAKCNDCHTPENMVAKYATKASNGFFHSLAFTLGGFPDNIRAKPRSHRVVEQACRKCHANLTMHIDSTAGADGTSCIRCHASVGHNENVASDSRALIKDSVQ
jgi:cytochrome c nitrite reductase small subunit